MSSSLLLNLNFDKYFVLNLTVVLSALCNAMYIRVYLPVLDTIALALEHTTVVALVKTGIG